MPFCGSLEIPGKSWNWRATSSLISRWWGRKLPWWLEWWMNSNGPAR